MSKTIHLLADSDHDGLKVYEHIRKLFKKKTFTYLFTSLPLKPIFSWKGLKGIENYPYLFEDRLKKEDLVIIADLPIEDAFDLDFIKKIAKGVHKVIFIDGHNHPLPKAYEKELKENNVDVFFCSGSNKKSYGHEAYECYSIYKKKINKIVKKYVD